MDCKVEVMQCPNCKTKKVGCEQEYYRCKNEECLLVWRIEKNG